MSSTAVVRALIDEHIKEEASAVLAAMGLTVSDAVRIMLTRVAHDKALPFELPAHNTAVPCSLRQAGFLSICSTLNYASTTKTEMASYLLVE